MSIKHEIRVRAKVTYYVTHYTATSQKTADKQVETVGTYPTLQAANQAARTHGQATAYRGADAVNLFSMSSKKSNIIPTNYPHLFTNVRDDEGIMRISEVKVSENNVTNIGHVFITTLLRGTLPGTLLTFRRNTDGYIEQVIHEPLESAKVSGGSTERDLAKATILSLPYAALHAVREAAENSRNGYLLDLLKETYQGAADYTARELTPEERAESDKIWAEWEREHKELDELYTQRHEEWAADQARGAAELAKISAENPEATLDHSKDIDFPTLAELYCNDGLPIVRDNS